MALLEGDAAQAGQVPADAFAAEQELLLVQVAAHLAQDPAEEFQLGVGRGRPFLELFDHRLGADAVGVLDLDEEVVADDGGLGRGGRERLQLGAAGVGDLEEAFVGPGLLDHLSALDQALLLQLGQLGVELLGEACQKFATPMSNDFASS